MGPASYCALPVVTAHRTRAAAAATVLQPERVEPGSMVLLVDLDAYRRDPSYPWCDIVELRCRVIGHVIHRDKAGYLRCESLRCGRVQSGKSGKRLDIVAERWLAGPCTPE